MSRVPKWLLLKEWLSYDDVIKVADTSPALLENVLAQDCSENFGLVFRFICTFSPNSCSKEFKEYRFENVARQSVRAHLKDHISQMKSKGTEDEKKEFFTRNHLFKGTKNACKHSKVSVKNGMPKKKVKRLKRPEKITFDLDKDIEQENQRIKRFTKLKSASPETTPVKTEEIIEEEEEEELDDEEEEEINDYQTPEDEPAFHDDEIEVEDAMDSKSEAGCSDEADGGDKVSCETQTEHNGKEQETFQYKVATKLFAVDRALWNDIEKVLDDIVSAEKSPEVLSEYDRAKILVGMRQWIESVQIYDNQTMSRLQDPLTQAERSILESMTSEDWKKLDTAQDSESKLRLTVYARLLLRDYECYPRKLKPKHCQHCGKHYTASTSLYSHLVSLSGIRFWVCSKCKDVNKEESTFTRKHSLQYHILKEVGIPRYRCTQPGCSKTHNHTHHQKSHARQHTGEKHYKCIVKDCKGRFSNRNTYSRHLLQFHSVELTRSNQLRTIDEEEARLKVYAARLKARERSKCKRQQGHDGNKSYNNVCAEQTKPEKVPKKMTIDENILTAAQHCLKAVRLEEGKMNESSKPSTELSLEKYMRPSASQLLYGIARDVRNTTSSLEEAKSSENMLGGLNLLATVSKYMNAENCNAADVPSVKEIVKHFPETKEQIKEELKEEDAADVKTEIIENSKMMEIKRENVKDDKPQQLSGKEQFNDIKSAIKCPPLQDKCTEGESSMVPRVVSVLDMHKLTKSYKKRKSGESHTNENTSESALARALTSDDPDLDCPPSKMKVLTIANVKFFPVSSSPSSTTQPSKLLRVIQSPVSQANRVINTVSTNSKAATEILPQAIKLSPNRYLIPFSKSSPESTSPMLQTSQGDAVSLSTAACPVTEGNIGSGAAETLSSRTFTIKHPLSSFNPESGIQNKNDPILPGRIISQLCTNFQATGTTNVQPGSTTAPVIKSQSQNLLSTAQAYLSSAGELRLNSPYRSMVSTGNSTQSSSVNCSQELPTETTDTSTIKSPLVPNVCVQNEPAAQGNATDANSVSTTPTPSHVPNKNIQVLKVTDTSTPLQLRSVSCMSGKTYIVLTSSANQSKTAQSVTTLPSGSTNSSNPARTLPFSEL